MFMGFSSQEYRSGLTFPSPGDLPNPKIKPALTGGFFFLPLPPPGKPKSFAKYLWRKVKVKVKSLSRVRLFVTPWTVAYQAPLSIGFSRQEYWSGLPFSSPGDLPDPGNEPRSPAL